MVVNFDKISDESRIWIFQSNRLISDLDIEFAIQEEPLGISHALLQAQPFLSDEDVTLFVLGDNFGGESSPTWKNISIK